MAKWKELSHNPLITAIAGALVGGIVGAVATASIGIFDRSDVGDIIEFLGHPVTVSRWTFGILCFGFLIGTGVAMYPLVGFVRSKCKKSRPFEDYTEGIINDIFWRWTWGSSSYSPKVQDIEPFCPKCDFGIVNQVVSQDDEGTTVKLYCPPCRRDFSPELYNTDQIYSDAKLEIERLARAM